MTVIFNIIVNGIVTYFLVKWLWTRLDRQFYPVEQLPRRGEEKCIAITKTRRIRSR